ncbi:hypothetical protein PFICI_06248 [Pestalotiopsis fici W106-1]|uniref:Uncharacterized protein n=1 Tax=Pestalotiopsis fici (strain W106-1 / CGMCC3.15140) TaxID=1229662 RepID=W3X7W5_PESFW|nr:uncharacterized protein PFICI_06248 [Pestalotiopsis fici W106-1]ETS81246.1 hypothetical protein PFICI_06248 [Pestalotiopsis fici W106-1]
MVKEARHITVRIGADARHVGDVKRVQVVPSAGRDQLAHVLAQVSVLEDLPARLDVDAVAQVRAARVPDLEALFDAADGTPRPEESALVIVARLVKLLAHEADELILVLAENPVHGRESGGGASSASGPRRSVCQPLGRIHPVFLNVLWRRTAPDASLASSVLIPASEG